VVASTCHLVVSGYKHIARFPTQLRGRSWARRLVGGWKQRDEDKWEEALDSIVEDLRQSEALQVEDGVHKIRMVVDIAIAKK
jgi:hypothetical protein